MNRICIAIKPMAPLILGTLTIIGMLGLGQSVLAQQQAPMVKIYTVPVVGPPDTDPGFSVWATSAVRSILSGNTVSTNLGRYLASSYFAQGSTSGGLQATNWTVRFATHLVAVNAGYKFSPNSLTFTEVSSDGLLNYSFTYTNPLPSYYGYNPMAMGVVWGLGGGAGTVLTNSESWTNTVNEFVFVGPQLKCYALATNYTLSSLGTYLDSAHVRISGDWSLSDGVNPTVSSVKTFYRSGGPARASLGIASYATGQYQITVAGGVGDTWIVQATPVLRSPSWSDILTSGGGTNTLGWSSAAGSMFFRAVLQ